MKPPSSSPLGLSEDEAQAWAQLAATVQPIYPPRNGEGDRPKPKAQGGGGALSKADDPANVGVKASKPSPGHYSPRVPLHPRPTVGGPPPRSGEDQGLDSSWERKLRAGTLAPDFTLDLHEHSLDAAYQRLLGGIDIARETGARVVLVIAGRARPVEAADRSGARGAIRAKVLDWLAASRHASAIAAIRKAHRRHGGEGALYVILKRPR